MSGLDEKPKHPYNDPIIIDGHSIFPGESETVRINVGRLPSDNRISILTHVFRAKQEGPCVLLLGGVHGDEINGMEIVRQSIESGLLDDLQCGTVIAIPLLNVFGFINFSREVPDGKDVNRSFPGSTSGSLASRVARTLSKKILPFVDYALDFHTGGASRYNFPQVRYTKTDKKAEQMARIFAATFTIQKPLISKSFRKTAKLMDIPAIVYEGGESVRLDGFAITKGVEGLKRILASFKMISPVLQVSKKGLLFKKSAWIRAPYSGLFIWTQKSGGHIKKDEPLGVIKDLYGTKSVMVISKLEGYVIGHNNASVVNQGDALFHIGLEYQEFS